MVQDWDDYYFGGQGSGRSRNGARAIPTPGWITDRMKDLSSQLSKEKPADYGSWSPTQKAEYSAKQLSLRNELIQLGNGVQSLKQGQNPDFKRGSDGSWSVGRGMAPLQPGKPGPGMPGGPEPSLPMGSDQLKALQEFDKYNQAMSKFWEDKGKNGYYKDGRFYESTPYEPMSLKDWLEGPGDKFKDAFPEGSMPDDSANIAYGTKGVGSGIGNSSNYTPSDWMSGQRPNHTGPGSFAPGQLAPGRVGGWTPPASLTSAMGGQLTPGPQSILSAGPAGGNFSTPAHPPSTGSPLTPPEGGAPSGVGTFNTGGHVMFGDPLPPDEGGTANSQPKSPGGAAPGPFSEPAGGAGRGNKGGTTMDPISRMNRSIAAGSLPYVSDRPGDFDHPKLQPPTPVQPKKEPQITGADWLMENGYMSRWGTRPIGISSGSSGGGDGSAPPPGQVGNPEYDQWKQDQINWNDEYGSPNPNRPAPPPKYINDPTLPSMDPATLDDQKYGTKGPWY